MRATTIPRAHEDARPDCSYQLGGPCPGLREFLCAYVSSIVQVAHLGGCPVTIEQKGGELRMLDIVQ